MRVNLNLLKQLRQQSGLTIAEVSTHLGFKSQQGYFYKETGVRNLSAGELGTLAMLYGVSSDDLLEPDGAEGQTA